MLGIALGLGASLCWGTSAFLGGFESRRSPQVGVMLASGAIGVLLLIVVAAASGTPVPAAKYMLIGAGGGAAMALAQFALYRGLAIGLMSVVAPIAATGVIVPVVIGIAGGERPSAVGITGIALAIGGVVFVSRQQGSSRAAAMTGLSVLLALIAALSNGAYFIALNEAAKGDPLWAAIATLGASFAVVAAVTVSVGVRRYSIKPRGGTWWWLLAIGLLNGGGSAFYATGTTQGQLSAVAVCSSLYPAVIVLLARGLLAERVARLQELGILAAIVGVVMIAIG